MFFRAFKFEPGEVSQVVFRLCHRENDVVENGGKGGVPFRIRREDLPPMPEEPLLDLVALDRTVRPRASLQPASGDTFPVRFAVRPAWQVDGGRAGETMYFAKRVDGRWLLFARDDAALDLVATAAKHEPFPFTVPARVVGEELPVLRIALQAR